MKKKFYALISSLLFFVTVGMGMSFSATIEIRYLDGIDETSIEPDTDFQVEIFIGLTPEESIKGIAGYEMYLKLNPSIEFKGHTHKGGYDYTFVKDPKDDIVRLGGIQFKSESIHQSQHLLKF